MSRPIYEPSLPRADAELGYGNRQLFRRPGPASAGDLPWICLKDIDTGQEFLDDEETVLVYQHEVNDYPATFDTATGFGGIYRVDILEDGLYSMSGNLRLDELTVGAFSIDLINIDPGAGPQIERASYVGANSITGPIVSGGADWSGIWRLNAGQAIFSILYNHTGSTFNSADDGGAYFEVRKLGSTTVNGRVRDSAT